MNPGQLIRMANQIGAFFEAMPDQARAAKDVADHIRRTWEPRMQSELLAHVARTGEEDLKPVVRAALALIR